MAFYKNFKNACSLRGRTIKEVCEKIGLGKRSSDNWTDHVPAVGTVLSLAKELNTTMEYLMGETDDIDAKISTQWEGLTEDEAELLTAYRKLNSEGKQRILGDSVSFTTDNRYKKDRRNIETA